MACSRCGADCFGVVCAACKGEVSIARVNVSLPPSRRSMHRMDRYGGSRVVDDGGNGGIYDEMFALKTALEAIADRIGALNPDPPLDLVKQCKVLALDLEMEIRKRRG